MGDHTLAGDLGRIANQIPSPATTGTVLALFTSAALSVHQSFMSMSEGAIEAVSLLVLGFSLLGAERALTRSRRTRDRALRARLSEGATPVEVASVSALARDRDGDQLRHRAVR